jgi:hypothetical protein
LIDDIHIAECELATLVVDWRINRMIMVGMIMVGMIMVGMIVVVLMRMLIGFGVVRPTDAE